jgi:hypothetical protein
MEKVAEGWRKLRSGKLHNLYASQIIIRVIKPRRIRWAGHVACAGNMRNSYNIFVRVPEGKKLFGRPRHRLDDNIRMDIWKMGWEIVD